jgi:GT2 family glycosyltransferase
MDVSILLPLSSDRLEAARACLESLVRAVGQASCEILLIDDRGAAQELLRERSGDARLRTVSCDRSRGLPASLNAAVREARAPALCLIDDGAALLPGWLEPMLNLLGRRPLTGCVGSVQREPVSGMIDSMGLRFNADGLPEPVGRNEPIAPPEPFSRWPAVSASCCAVRRSLFDRLGGFDERFRRDFADVDFCLRAAEVGAAHYTAHRSVIYHHPAPAPVGVERDWADQDLTLFRERWGGRIAAFFQRREAARLAQKGAGFTRADEEVWQRQWQLKRETLRQTRQDIVDARQDGRRYLRKHLLRPWRYIYRRVRDALVKASHPSPSPLPPEPPRLSFEDVSAIVSQSAAHPAASETMLFDPPRQ